MRVLALDHGTVRVGVAVSDELGIIARPLEFIPAAKGMRFAVDRGYVHHRSSY